MRSAWLMLTALLTMLCIAPFQQGLHVVERFPGCVCVDAEVAALPPRSTWALPHRTREEENIPGEAREAKGAEPSDKKLAYDKWRTESWGGFGSPQQPPTPCWNNGDGTWHLQLEGWSTGGNWIGCGMEGWNRLTASQAPLLATNSQILTQFRQRH